MPPFSLMVSWSASSVSVSSTLLWRDATDRNVPDRRRFSFFSDILFDLTTRRNRHAYNTHITTTDWYLWKALVFMAVTKNRPLTWPSCSSQCSDIRLPWPLRYTTINVWHTKYKTNAFVFVISSVVNTIQMWVCAFWIHCSKPTWIFRICANENNGIKKSTDNCTQHIIVYQQTRVDRAGRVKRSLLLSMR